MPAPRRSWRRTDPLPPRPHHRRPQVDHACLDLELPLRCQPCSYSAITVPLALFSLPSRSCCPVPTHRPAPSLPPSVSHISSHTRCLVPLVVPHPRSFLWFSSSIHALSNPTPPSLAVTPMSIFRTHCQFQDPSHTRRLSYSKRSCIPLYLLHRVLQCSRSRLMYSVQETTYMYTIRFPASGQKERPRGVPMDAKLHNCTSAGIACTGKSTR